MVALQTGSTTLMPVEVLGGLKVCNLSHHAIALLLVDNTK